MPKKPKIPYASISKYETRRPVLPPPVPSTQYVAYDEAADLTPAMVTDMRLSFDYAFMTPQDAKPKTVADFIRLAFINRRSCTFNTPHGMLEAKDRNAKLNGQSIFYSNNGWLTIIDYASAPERFELLNDAFNAGLELGLRPAIHFVTAKKETFLVRSSQIHSVF